MIDINNSRDTKKQFWKVLGDHMRKGNKFFEDLELLPDALELWDYVQKHDHFICTATGHMMNAGFEKRAAVRRHFGIEASNAAILVKHSELKALHASPTTILIDDRTKSINPWIEAGGIGILHKSTSDTIRQLKELGVD